MQSLHKPLQEYFQPAGGQPVRFRGGAGAAAATSAAAAATTTTTNRQLHLLRSPFKHAGTSAWPHREQLDYTAESAQCNAEPAQTSTRVLSTSWWAASGLPWWRRRHCRHLRRRTCWTAEQQSELPPRQSRAPRFLHKTAAEPRNCCRHIARARALGLASRAARTL